MDWDHNALAVVKEEHLNCIALQGVCTRLNTFLVRMKISEGIELSEILNKHQALFACLFYFFHEFWTLRWVAMGPFYSLCLLSRIPNFSYSSITQSKTRASCCMKFRLRIIETLGLLMSRAL